MFKFSNVNAYNIAVTGSAAVLTALIDTAASTDNQNIPSTINAVLLMAEDGDIRFTTDGNTPTSSAGVPLKQGFYAFITGVKPSDIKLIRTGGSNVKVDVMVGQGDQKDGITIGPAAAVATNITGGGGATIKDDTAYGDAVTAGILSMALRIYNGATYDRARGDGNFNLKVTPQATAAGGATPGKVISAASTNATSIKGSAGQLYMATGSNNNASPRYIKFYDKASAPTVGTDVPKTVIELPGNSSGAGSNIPIPATGLEFTNGIALAITGGIQDSDTTAVLANEVIANYATK